MIRHVSTTLLLGLLVTAVACGDDPAEGNDTDAGTGKPDGSDTPDGSTVDPDGSTPDGSTPDPVNRVVCPTTITAAPAGQLCAVTPGSSDKVLIQATVLAGDTVYENGAVLVDRSNPNGTILCTGCDCEAEGATVIACAEGVLSPGLINAHDHTPFNVKGTPKGHGDERFDHRHDWRVGKRGHGKINTDGSSNNDVAIKYAELRMLLSGATSLVGSGGASGLVRNLDDAAADGGLGAGRVDYRTFPLGDSGGTLRAEGCNYDNIDAATRLNARIYLPHIAEGIDAEARNEYACLSGGAVDVIAANTSIVHGIGLTAADIADIAARGAKLVWSPRTNIDLYGQTADVLTYRRFGVNIALGTDWILSGSMNMLRELQCADHLNQNYYARSFSDYEIWRMATANSAVAMGVADKLGEIKNGLIADLALFDGRGGQRKDFRAVIEAGVDDVALVLRGGAPLYGDAALIDGLASDAGKCDTLDVCTRDKKVCTELDSGSTLAAIQSAAGASYPLFFCGTPDNEPKCVPSRPDEYTGQSSASDRDGDGLPDDQDNCSEIFNPRRPLDANQQPNYDQDAYGDSCDVCPLNEGSTCTGVDPNDRDGDGVPNGQDNCPDVSNPDQLDSDGDGKGDACDACPQESNPGDAKCTATIYEIKQRQKWAVGDSVRIKDALVIGSGKDGVFLQAAAGGNFSGLFAFTKAATKPAQGDKVNLTGTIAEFNGQIQVQDLVDIETLSQNNTLPAPTVVPTTDLTPNSARGTQLEGTLVRVEGATATAFAANFVETALNGGDVLIDDILFDYTPPAIGTVLDVVQGPLAFRFGAHRINPRAPADLVIDQNAPRVVASLSPAALTVPPGQSRVLNVNLNLPAQVGGMVVNLTAAPANFVGIPATVTVPEGQSSAQITVNAVAAAGDGSISAAVAGQNPAITAAVTIAEAAAGSLIISEYLEGSGQNKAIEIYNGGATPLNLADYLLCQTNRGGNGTITANSPQNLALTGTLAAGAVRTYCHTDLALGFTCDVRTTDVVAFNGNDSVYLVKKDAANGTCAANSTVVDAFGPIAGNVAGTPWADKTYSRCDLTPYLGVAAFNLLGTYTESPQNSFAGFGQPPAQVCAP